MKTTYQQENQAGRSVIPQSLGLMNRGSTGRVLAVRGDDGEHDLERGLLEMGIVENAYIEVLHHGFWGRDPLAVRINRTMTVALRRREAHLVLIDSEAALDPEKICPP